jgi:hypothetical protein
LTSTWQEWSVFSLLVTISSLTSPVGPGFSNNMDEENGSEDDDEPLDPNFTTGEDGQSNHSDNHAKP